MEEKISNMCRHLNRRLLAGLTRFIGLLLSIVEDGKIEMVRYMLNKGVSRSFCGVNLYN